MTVWRVSNHETIEGRGGLRASARWHTRGHRIVYCTPNPATALLEGLVHAEIGFPDLPLTYRFLEIEIPDSVPCEVKEGSSLPAGWRANQEITQRVGDEWLESLRSALLFVPCVIVPETRNILINPSHTGSAEIKIVKIHKQRIDERLAFK